MSENTATLYYNFLNFLNFEDIDEVYLVRDRDIFWGRTAIGVGFNYIRQVLQLKDGLIICLTYDDVENLVI